jgi:hypothetical protein
MNGRRDNANLSKSSHNPKHDETADDRWLADFPNDLGVISLSTDDIPAQNYGEMGCLSNDPRNPGGKPHHKHGDVGC